MTLLHSLLLPLGSPLIDFSLPDPHGKLVSTQDFSDRKVLVVIFMCNHCPYVQAVLERLIELQSSYKSEEVRLIGINANDWEEYPDDSPEAMKKMIEEKGINFPYLYDESQEVAKEYQAQCTPDIFVFDSSRKLSYHGRVDELKKAIDAMLKGDVITERQHPSMGCSIKWRT